MTSITWLAQACIVFTKQGKDKKDEQILVMDPYGKELGLSLPSLQASIVTVSHDHWDHNNIAAISGNPFVIREPGEYEVAGFAVEAIPSFHDAQSGKKRGDNLIVRIQAPEFSFAHFGDFGQDELTPEQIEALGDVDIAFIPVGGTFTMDGTTAAKVISQLEPKVAIPIHYQIPNISVTELSGPEGFFEAMGQKPTVMKGEWKIKFADLPSEGIKVVQLEPQAK